MVKALHRAGIEVILDVVFNHTAEGGRDGPTFCYRGLANDFYYMLEDDKSRYADYTGCGNTLNANHPIVRRLIQDSLRYWVTADARRRLPLRPRVDPVARRDGSPAAQPADPLGHRVGSVLAGTKLIAEAWDAAGLYQVGSFVGDTWQEWNGRFRDDVRHFLQRRRRLGTSDRGPVARQPRLYGHEEREAEQSINFVTLPRRLHAQRPRLLQPEAQRGQRRAQSRRLERQPELELRRRRADRRSGRSRRCATARSRTSSRWHCSRPARRCCSWATRCAGRSAATTTPIARTARSAGSTGACSSGIADIHRFVKVLIAFRQRRDVVRQKPPLRRSTSCSPRTHRVARRGARSPRLEPTTRTRWRSRWKALGGRFWLHGMLNAYWEPLTFEMPPLHGGQPAHLATLPRHGARLASRHPGLGYGQRDRHDHVPRAAAFHAFSLAAVAHLSAHVEKTL